MQVQSPDAIGAVKAGKKRELRPSSEELVRTVNNIKVSNVAKMWKIDQCGT